MVLMACSCKGKKNVSYQWTSSDGESTMTYDTEIQAKAKVLRKGGSYTVVEKDG